LGIKHLAAIHAAETEAEISALLMQWAHSRDFGLYTACICREARGRATKVSYIANVPAGYEDAFKDVPAGLRDPVIQRLKISSLPFAYGRKTYTDAKAGDLWDIQAPFGFGSGVAVSVSMPEGLRFILGLDRDTRLPPDRQTVRVLGELQLIAAYSQRNIARLLGPKTVFSRPQLTRRELQVMHWASHGKSAWATGQLIKCSGRTVNFHVQNVLKKLQVDTKLEATLLLTRMGVLPLTREQIEDLMLNTSAED
jgi:DNA-binding CsgD family transcriptional regulator